MPALVTRDAVGRGLQAVNTGRLEEGLRTLSREARNDRLNGDAQHAYGLGLLAAERFQEAIAQFLRADRLKPDRWQVQQNLSAAYHGLRDYDAAYRTATRSLELNPDNFAMLYHLGDLHLIWGEMVEANAYYERALAINPRHADTWMGKLFALDLIPGVTGGQALAERQRYANAIEQPISRYRLPHRQSREPDRQLRVGFISGDFRDHTAGYMFGPLYEHLDRDQFLVFSYSSVAPEDADSITRWLQSASNGWRQIVGCSTQQVVQAIRADEIDILVDTAGFTNGGHLPVFCAKPAPLQVQAWGYLTGSGLDAMDAILVDDVLVPPEHEHHFSERLVRVPYALGFAINGDVPIIERPEGRPLTFGHLGRSDKVSRDAVRLWARVLHAHPESRMLLKDRGFRMARTQTRIEDWFAEEGVGLDRLDIRGPTPRGEHLATYREVDLVLDSVPQGGGTTTIEALHMGTPVVTMLGPRIIGRIAATTLHAVGHDEWIAANEDEYVQKAAFFAHAGGPHLRDEIVSSVVFDSKARTRAFEAALRELWRNWCRRQSTAASHTKADKK